MFIVYSIYIRLYFADSGASKSETHVKHDTSTAKVRCTCKSDDSGSDDSENVVRSLRIPPHSYPVPRPGQYTYRTERIQPVRTHTEDPVFTFLPEKRPPYIQTSARPMFTSTSRPVMVPQVAARLVDPYGQYGVEEVVVDEPWADGYVNPVYLGEGEIMQPSAQAIITPHDTQYALVPRYVTRSLPSSPEPPHMHTEDESPKGKKASKRKPYPKVKCSMFGYVHVVQCYRIGGWMNGCLASNALFPYGLCLF